LAIAAPALTDPPLVNDHSCLPFAASNANIVGASTGAKSEPIEAP
jgi:hypothetical protein